MSTNFTLETSSFGTRIFLKSSPNRVIKTYQHVFVTGEVAFNLYHTSDTNKNFAVAIRRDDGSYYDEFLGDKGQEINIKKINDVEPLKTKTESFTECFDECPRGTWQIQVFMLDENGLTEEFIYIDLVFTNVLQIKEERKQGIDLGLLEFNIPQQQLVIGNTYNSLSYYFVIYRQNSQNNYELYYTSKSYNTTSNIILDWQTFEGFRTIEKHILAGLNSNCKVFIMIQSDSRGPVSEFTYQMYKLSRQNNVIISGNRNLGNLYEKPELPLTITSSFDSTIIPYYRIKCDWILMNGNNAKRLLYTKNYFYQNNSNTSQGHTKSNNHININNIFANDTDDTEWFTKILPEYYFGELFDKINIKVTVTGCSFSDNDDIYSQEISVDENISNFTFTRKSKPPILNINKNFIGDINTIPKEEDITYVVKDEDSKKLIVQQKIDLTDKELELILKQFTINEINGKINFNFEKELLNTPQIIDTTDFYKLTDGKHTYTIIVGDGVNPPIVENISFNKIPNKAPVISGCDDDLGDIFRAPEIFYTVNDFEGDRIIVREYFDNELLFEQEYSSVPTSEKLINCISRFKKAQLGKHEIRIEVTDFVSLTVRKYSFNKIKGPAPIIIFKDQDKKKIFKYRDLKYAVKDESDIPIIVQEFFNDTLIKEYRLTDNTAEAKDMVLDYSEQFKSVRSGIHYIKIKVDNSYEITERIYTIEKLNNTQIYNTRSPIEIGRTSSNVNVKFDIYNILNNYMRYDILLNSEVISMDNIFTNVIEQIEDKKTYRLDYTLSKDSTIFMNLDKNKEHTLQFRVIDIDVPDKNGNKDGCTQTYSYTFTKIGKIPNIEINKDQFNAHMLQIKDIEIKCETNSSGGELLISINGIPTSNSPINITGQRKVTTTYDLPDSDWIELDKDKIYEIQFILKDNETSECDIVNFEFTKGHTDAFAWKPSVSNDGVLSWNVDESRNPPEEVNIIGPKGDIGKTPKIAIGNITEESYDKAPNVIIRNPEDPENPILDFVFPLAPSVKQNMVRLVYDSDIPSTIAVGGLEKGWFPKNESGQFEPIPVVDLIFQMLHPYEEPIIDLSTNIGRGGVVKKGLSRNITSFSININNNGNTIRSIKLFQNSTLLKSFTDDIQNGGEFNYSKNITINSTTTFKVEVTDNKKTITKDIVFNFVNPFYSGCISSIPPTGITGLIENVSEKSNKTITFNGSKCYAVFAYPASYNDIVKIIDQNGFVSTTAFKKITLDINSEQYNFYYKEQMANYSDFKYTFNF